MKLRVRFFVPAGIRARARRARILAEFPFRKFQPPAPPYRRAAAAIGLVFPGQRRGA
jgi:hypothetical protein